MKNQLFCLLETKGNIVKTCLMYYTEIAGNHFSRTPHMEIIELPNKSRETALI